jgi:hypothetical protein
MPAPEGSTALARLREALSSRVEQRSLRRVAREVGMSPSGLQKFLGGTRPYSGTRRKLERWYVREAALDPTGAMSHDLALAALRVLVHDLPIEGRGTALRRLTEALERSYGVAGVAAPSWLHGFSEPTDESPRPEISPGSPGSGADRT